MSGEDPDEQWRRDALCTGNDPDTFFPEKGGNTADAKKVCGQCQVRAECLDYALNADERFGVWGGLSTAERDRLIKNSPSTHRSAAQAQRQKRDALILAMAGRGTHPRAIADTAEVTDRTVYRVLARRRERQDAVSA
ncbi:WhiB family transcriptional regulator [Pseudarthrobacter sp. NPDC058196]|uniref:WhiB family transcriptional regulator n=1 Tax=Pseudarthrobacter sp. NPDC058196 TaxID=3346376 RepID=UPI0036DACEC1